MGDMYKACYIIKVNGNIKIMIFFRTLTKLFIFTLRN